MQLKILIVNPSGDEIIYGVNFTLILERLVCKDAIQPEVVDTSALP